MTEWQPISAAPKGKVILLFAVTDRSDGGEIRNWKMATGYTPFDGPVEWTWDGDRLREWDVKPSHWMVLPAPPSDENIVRERDRYQKALRLIENINNGPDRASSEYRCQEAAQIAREALKTDD